MNGRSELGSDLDPDPWKIIWIRIRIPNTACQGLRFDSDRIVKMHTTESESKMLMVSGCF